MHPEDADGGEGDDGPVRRRRLTATDTDEAVELMRSVYGDQEPRFRLPRREARLSIASRSVTAPGGTFNLDRVRHSLGMDVRRAPVDRTAVLLPVTGRVRFTCGDEEATGLRLVPTREAFDSAWDDGVDVVGYAVDTDAVSLVGGELSGLEPSAVRFDSMLPVDAARERYLVQAMSHLGRDTLDNPEALATPLVRAATLRHLATVVLLTFPNTALDAAEDPTRAGPGRAEPATVRRAAAYIETHAHEPIGLDDIAVAARIGARGLQHAFARHRDTTPLGYLRRVRLDRAHRELRGADPSAGDTVAAIATRWGFAHGGRFSAEYRHVYGCSPSETLRR
ncbi:AraC-like DNA-binding protein [Actinomycetospora succinea]|uniref:AraC-like DNA-binding protein n=1 Tax=Actinomycetospora succinea TaxID=663603 RepID=A0A4R6UUE4_9PSEU|nr:AraC family transcriptional regulator [Actinomycetospora succinea]TDQ48995.1 AraC-like DNA-binding protein [Actinomycetospora succinea]